MARASCDPSGNVIARLCRHLSVTWTQGRHQLLVPFRTVHLSRRNIRYTEGVIRPFREDTWGLGYGRGRYDESGNWSELSATVFLDSHDDLEYTIGYDRQWVLGQPNRLNAGIGFSLIVTARSDYGYLPLPGVVPTASASVWRATVNVSYVPNLGGGNGNLVFLWARFGL